MKNPGVLAMILVCCICVSFIGGFFLGRNFNHSEVQISINNENNSNANNSNVNNAQSDSDENAGKININTATAAELELLPGIGETLAGRIIAYREEHGAFGSVSELINVSGIGEGKLEAILDYVTIGD